MFSIRTVFGFLFITGVADVLIMALVRVMNKKDN